MTTLYDVIKRPILTEKSTLLRDRERKVVLEVDTRATKTQIKMATQKLFNVKVEDVKTSIVRGKTKRVGKSIGRQSNFKKAVLTIAAGADLDVFGVQMGAPAAEGENA
jgi:large subunit ribosomal protein L23